MSGAFGRRASRAARSRRLVVPVAFVEPERGGYQRLEDGGSSADGRQLASRQLQLPLGRRPQEVLVWHQGKIGRNEYSRKSISL